MNITSKSQPPPTLTSLIDSNLRQRQQALQNQQKAAKQSGKIADNQAKNQERQNRINANRTALRELQAQLKANNLTKLKTAFPSQNARGQGTAGTVNLNLRESHGNNNKPVNSRPGQIIDIKV